MTSIKIKYNLSGGEFKTLSKGEIIFERSDALQKQPVFFIAAGLVRLQYLLADGSEFKYYVESGSVFGIEECVQGIFRLCDAVAAEKTQIYLWDLESYYQASEGSPKLAINSIRSLSRLLRIMNSEYGDLLTQANEEAQLMKSQDELEADTMMDVTTKLPLPQGNSRQVFKNRQVLIKEGDLPERVFWILSGEVLITRKMEKSYKVLAKAGKGELVGEMSFFDKSLSSATVVANGEVQAMVFSQENFKELFYANSKWTKQLLSRLSTRVVNMVQQLTRYACC
ncbi:MAG: cyclic nucleotide-binding domain-containing protein [Spirochaetales bacterium]|nr:cyclic nucleotide-binding domain-containing protein [Spirochaetales bacterium]